MNRTSVLGPNLAAVCRLGLATRGNGHIRRQDVEAAVDRGIGYLNWCGHADGMSSAIAAMGAARERLVVAAQFQSRSAADAEREFSAILQELNTDYIDVLTLYYVESEQEWAEILAPGGAWNFLAEQRSRGKLKMIGLTSHQRTLAARWAESGKLDALMIRYNAAHRGARREIFPVTPSSHLTR